MRVELVPCYTDKDWYLHLAKEYVDTMSRYSEEVKWDRDAWDRAVWDASFIVDGGILCGFVCSSDIEYKNKPRLKIIEEIYVEKDERRRGVGTEAVRVLLEGFDGDVCVYILNRNQEAKEFWTAVEDKLGWIRTERKDIRRWDDSELRVFKNE